MSFAPPVDWGPLDGALDRLESYAAVAFTSPRAAAAVGNRLAGRRKPPKPNTLVWAAGEATQSALGGLLGPVRTAAVADLALHGAAEALARAMLEAGTDGPVLFPCGDNRRDALPDRLRSCGLRVDEVVCYRSVLASKAAAQAAADRSTVLVVASPSVADLLIRACPPNARPDLVAVGPTTAAAARASGWSPAAVADRPSVEALAAAVRSVLATRAPHE